MQDDGKRRHEPDTQKAAEEVIEREDRYAWILLHEPGKLYISEKSPRRGDISVTPFLRVLLHVLSPPFRVTCSMNRHSTSIHIAMRYTDYTTARRYGGFSARMLLKHLYSGVRND